MDFLQTIEQDAEVALADVKKGLVFLEGESATVIAWVERVAPDSAGAIAQFLQVAEADAQTLATMGGQGLAGVLANAADDVETLLLNVIQNSGLAKNAQGALSGIDVAGINMVKTAGQALISTGLAKVLASIATAAGNSQVSMAPIPAPVSTVPVSPTVPQEPSNG